MLPSLFCVVFLCKLLMKIEETDRYIEAAAVLWKAFTKGKKNKENKRKEWWSVVHFITSNKTPEWGWLQCCRSCQKNLFCKSWSEHPLREGSQKKLRKFGHMSKLSLPYLPRSIVWTKKKVWTSTSIVYPTYLSKTFGHFYIKFCS